MVKNMKKTLKRFLFSGFIFSILFATSFCSHQNIHQKNNRNVSSIKSVSGWNGPKVVQTPAGDLHVYHYTVDNEEPAITHVDVKYICKGKSLKDWKRFKVQWFYGVENPSSGSSVIPLVYDPIAELSFSGDSSDSPANDTKTTVRERFNLETRCQRD